MARILSDKEVRIILKLWNPETGRGATFIKEYCVNRFGKEIARSTIYEYIEPRYRQRPEPGICRKCGGNTETHKKCRRCKILLHEEPWIPGTNVGLKGDKGKCVECESKIYAYG